MWLWRRLRRSKRQDGSAAVHWRLAAEAQAEAAEKEADGKPEHKP